MKVLIFSFFLACASAQYWPSVAGPYSGYSNFYGGYGYSGYNGFYGYNGYPYGAPIASQYNSRDAFGQSSYGYAYPGQAATNFQDVAGNQIGSYAYVNPNGKEVRVSYVADANGFRVASNDLPVAPVANLQAPLPVQDTPEVAAVKAKLALAKAAIPTISRNKRQVFSGLVNSGPSGYLVGAYGTPKNQFVNDLFSRSVDLNKDGQPDSPVISTGYPTYPTYTGLPVTPYTGLPVTPYTGLPVTPYTGLPVTPYTGLTATPYLY